jgi:hypothetical protein
MKAMTDWEDLLVSALIAHAIRLMGISNGP